MDPLPEGAITPEVGIPESFPEPIAPEMTPTADPDYDLAAPGDYVGPVRSDPMFDPEGMVGPGGAPAVPGVEETFFGRFGDAEKTPEVDMYERQKPAPVEMSDAWTYEQTWMDPFIKQNLMKRKPVELQSTMADIAAGQMSPVIQQQRERAIQSALATAASARGMPTSATQRMMTQQMSEADRSAMEAAAQQQLQAGQQVDQMAQVDAQINAQLEQQRDGMLDSLVGRGVDRNVALAQVNAEMERLKTQLKKEYWAGRLGAGTEVLKQAYEQKDFLEGGVESVAELAPVLNMLFGAPTPGGYGLPQTQILSDYTDDPQGIFTETTMGGTPGMDEMVWNHETQSWEMQPGQPGVPQSLGVQDFGGNLVEVWRTWNQDKMIYEYSFQPGSGMIGSSGGQSGGGGQTPDEEPDYPEGGAPL
tara:strand:- start:3706 stop:4959 length:1254 start_codon:yes stop_codon:yes gene_type:complete